MTLRVPVEADEIVYWLDKAVYWSDEHCVLLEEEYPHNSVKTNIINEQ